MNDNNIDFNTKLKKISKDLVASFFKNNDSSTNNEIKENNNESNQSSQIIEKNISLSEISNNNNNNNKDFPILLSENNNLIKNNIIATSNKGLLFTEQTTKSSVSNNYIPYSSKNMNQITSLKNKTNNKINNKTLKNKNNINTNINKTFSSSQTYTNFLAKQESTREKKIFLEKIQNLRNHIKALKKHQLDIVKKEEKDKEKEKYKNKMKKQKEKIKQALLSAEIDRRNEMEQKRKKIAENKIKESKGIKISQGKIKNDKMKEYQKAMIQKRKLEKIINDDINKSTELNKVQIDKIKTEREKNKKIFEQKRKNNINKINNSYKLTYQTNINETKKLKDELTRLEKLEKNYLENLDYSIDSIKKSYIENKNKGGDIKENYKIKVVKRNANSVMKRYIINEKNNLSRNERDKSNSLSSVINNDQ